MQALSSRPATPGYDEQKPHHPYSQHPAQPSSTPRTPPLNKIQRQNVLHSRHGLRVRGDVLLLHFFVVPVLIRVI